MRIWAGLQREVKKSCQLSAISHQEMHFDVDRLFRLSQTDRQFLLTADG